MNHEHYNRGKNWYSAIGLLFIIMASIVFGQQLYLWGPEFVLDFIMNKEITNEKISLMMIMFGILMIVIGFKKNAQPR